jgi:hypothetical protein
MSEHVHELVLVDSAATPTAVETRMVFPGTPEQVWSTIMFYEQLEGRPPLHLRLLLPEPVETIGSKSQPGDEARCVYRSGHLIKRITSVDPGVRYTFEIAEQALSVGGSLKLSGGSYTLREVAPGQTEVALVTRYTSHKWPRWLWRPIEAAVCHSFHRHILRQMRRAMRPA